MSEKRLPYGEWLSALAGAMGMTRSALANMTPQDRATLLARRSGMPYERFKSMPLAQQVEALQRNRDVDTGEGEGEGEGEGGGQAEAEGQSEGQGEGEAEAEAECGGDGESEQDPWAGLELLRDKVQGEIKKQMGAGGGSRVEVKLPGLPPKDIGEHVHPVFETVLKLALQRLPVMLVGPAGCGKTTMCRQVANALSLEFGSVSCSAGMGEGALLGRLLPDETGAFRYVQPQFVTLYENGGLFLLDEIDAADPNVLLALNTATGSVTGRGSFHNDLRKDAPLMTQHKDSVIVAAANTFGTGSGSQYVGRSQLDAATLDRFIVIEMDYDQSLEKNLGDAEVTQWAWSLREKAREASLRRVVSTRMIEKGTSMKALGFDMPFIRKTLLTGWSRDELVRVGV